MKSLKSQNYYEILGVSRDASAQEIRDAYEVSRQTFQEDSLATYSLFSEEENQEILALISRAYETLYDPERRREYDDYLDSTQPGARGGQRDARPTPPPPGTVRLPSEDIQERHAPRFRATASPARREEPARLQAAGANDEEPVEGGSAEGEADAFIQSISAYNGEVLRKVRELRGMSLEELAERTKIRKTYIEYIEDENFAFLPAAVYIKGFVTTLASQMGLPAKQVAEDYMDRYRSTAG